MVGSTNTMASKRDYGSSVCSRFNPVYASPLPSYPDIRVIAAKRNSTKSGLLAYRSTIEPLTFQDTGFSIYNLNVEIPKQRIKYVVDHALQKLELIMSMARLLETDAGVLTKHCTASEVNCVMECYAKYAEKSETPRSSSRRTRIGDSTDRSSIKSRNTRDRSTVTWSLPTRTSSTYIKPVRLLTRKKISDPQIAKVINILCRSSRLRMLAKETFQTSGTESAKLLLEKFRIVRDSFLERMNTPLYTQSHRNVTLREIWIKNEALKAEIRQLQTEGQRVINTYNSQLLEKDKIIADYEEKIYNLREQFEQQQEGCMKKSEFTMKKKLNKSVMVQDDTLTAIEGAQKKIDKTVPMHLEAERKLRMRRLRLEARLDTQITKYDNAMSKRQVEYDQLIAEVKKEKERVAHMRELLAVQDKTYKAMLEKQEAEKRWERNRKIHLFQQNHCARIIQRCWRAYKAQCEAENAARIKAEKLEKKKAKQKAKSDAKFSRGGRRK